jgi:hypothetical protein
MGWLDGVVRFNRLHDLIEFPVSSADRGTSNQDGKENPSFHFDSFCSE